MTFQKANMRTSCIKQITVRHDGDVKGIYFLTLLLSMEWFLFIHLIILFAMNNATIVHPLVLFEQLLNSLLKINRYGARLFTPKEAHILLTPDGRKPDNGYTKSSPTCKSLRLR